MTADIDSFPVPAPQEWMNQRLVFEVNGYVRLTDIVKFD